VKGEDARAIADLTRYIELVPLDVQGYLARGAIYERLGEKEKADADYQKATELRKR
jgi:Flp pilus assembly protein TadD